MVPTPGTGGGAGVKSYVETGTRAPSQTATTGTASTGAADTVLTVAGEIVGVSLLALVAGASNDAGNAVIALMLALWLIYLVTSGSVIIGGISSKFSAASAAVQ